MQIILIADIHIKYLSKYPVFEEDRLKKLQAVLNEQHGNAVWILGDLFDSATPSVKELKMAKDFIAGLDVPVSYLEGNHERVNSQNYILKDLSSLLGITPIPPSGTLLSITYKAYGHNHIHDISTGGGADILLSHFRWSHPIYKQGELSTEENNIANMFTDIILGDIHYKYNPRPNVTYTSSPYTITHSKVADTGFIILDITTKGYKIIHKTTHLPNKLRLTIPLSKVVKLLATLDMANLYKIDVLVPTTKDLKVFDSLHLPPCVHIFKPILVVPTTKKSSVPKVVIKDNLLSTFLGCLPKHLKDDHEYIIQSLGGTYED